MKKRWKVISAVVIGIFLLTMAAVPALAQTTATRDIADQTLAPGESTNVTVTINNAQEQGLGLDEDPPAAWTVAVVSSGGGSYKAADVAWFWMQAAAGTITVTYNLTVPLGTAAGTYTISGILISAAAPAGAAVGGESTITVSGVPPAATTATRDIADQALAPGESTNVTVTITNAQLQALGLDEDPPAGWPVAAVSSGGGQYKAADVAWLWTQAAAGTITVVYNLTVPAGTADGTYAISGTLFSGEDGAAVGGESTITVSAVVTPPEPFEDTFDGCLDEGDTETLVVIPAGATDLDIQLDATADLDLELWDGATHVIGWQAKIKSKGPSTGTYEGDVFGYSGWDAFDEYITADGPLGQAYTVKVYGFKAGCYDVTVSYMPPGPDFDAPVITITAPDGTVGSPLTVRVSATDFSGVAWVFLAVSSPAPGGGASPESIVIEDVVAMVLSYDDEASITFVPGWSGIYTVEAWARDMQGNMTPEGAPKTATFEVD